MILNELKFENI